LKIENAKPIIAAKSGVQANTNSDNADNTDGSND